MKSMWRIILQVPMLLCWTLLPVSISQVADPVAPCFDQSQFPSFFSAPQIPDRADVYELARRGAMGYHKFACLSNTAKPDHCSNKVFENLNETELRADRDKFFTGTTYWFNEFLHVGHVFYDIVLMQILQTKRVDRIIMQRPACHGALCVGHGSIDSFYRGYFAALFDAFNQPNIPIYLRWGWKDKALRPLYFTTDTADLYQNDTFFRSRPQQLQNPIQLHNSFCFEEVLRRTNLDYGAIPAVSASAVQQFKDAAYRMVNSRTDHDTTRSTDQYPITPLLISHFQEGPPYRILFSHRGPRASRRIANHDDFIDRLLENFPRSDGYIIRVMNNSDPWLDYKTQIQAVAEAHVIVTNHGAFEGNMMYMRNGSMMLEIFGHYGNNEIHMFHRSALMFGVHYARVQSKALSEHGMSSFELSQEDIENILGHIRSYFDAKPYLHHLSELPTADAR